MRNGKLITDMQPGDQFFFRGFQRFVSLERAKIGHVGTVTIENMATGAITIHRWNINDRIESLDEFTPQYAPGYMCSTWRE